MKLRPTACWRMRTSPGPGAGTSTLSYVRTSGPPTLCTRTALVIVRSPGYFPPANRKPSGPRCQPTAAGIIRFGLARGFLAIALRKHVEEFNGGRKYDGEIDVTARDVEFESVGYQRHPNPHPQPHRQHLAA